MNKDFAKKRRARSSRAAPHVRSVPTWLWILCGLLLGSGAAVVLYWKIHPLVAVSRPDVIVTLENASGKLTAQSVAKSSVSSTGELRFDFYNLLPNMAQELPELAKTTLDVTPKTAVQSSASPADATSYLIQVGSFRVLEQAQELKIRLAKHGVTASIQTYSNNHHDTWYRVYVGPFENKSLALASQQELEHVFTLHSLIIKNRV